MKDGFLNSISGRKSSSRLYTGMILIYAMVMSFLILLWGKEGKESIISLATAAGIFFTTAAGPVLVWMYNQKKTEVQKEQPKENE